MQEIEVDQLIGKRLGNYQVDRVLEKGRLVAVYRVLHQSLQRIDVLALYLMPQQLPQDERERFLARFREVATVVVTLKHPNILPMYAYGEYAGYPYIVTPYIIQESLANVLRRKGRCDYVYALSILRQIVEGLAYAHERGIVHGGLKPANIIFQSTEVIQIAGLGLTQMLQKNGIKFSTQPYSRLLSIADTMLIAPEYVAPEVVVGRRVDSRSDVYSLGCILFEMLSGRPPFYGGDPLDIAKRHVTQAAPSLSKLCPDIPAILASVIHQALESDPAQRFRSIIEFGEAFDQAVMGAAYARTKRMLTTTTEERKNQEDQSLLDKEQKLDRLPSTEPSSLISPLENTMRTTDPAQFAQPIVTHIRPRPAPAPPTNAEQAALLSANKPAQSEPSPSSFGEKPTETGSATPHTHSTANWMSKAQAKMPDLVKILKQWPSSGSTKGLVPGQDGQAIPPEPSSSAKPTNPAADDGANWTFGLPQPVSSDQLVTVRSASSRPIKRRKVVVGLIIGCAVAINGSLILNECHPMKAPSSQGVLQKQKKQGPEPGKQPAKVEPKQTQNAAVTPVGTTIGSVNQPEKTARLFANPGDTNESLLLHLPTGQFIAYERTCTHEDVKVNYDPNLNLLICPAHGSVFDPENGGQVVQGPALKPLPTITIRINTDGTIAAI